MTTNEQQQTGQKKTVLASIGVGIVHALHDRAELNMHFGDDMTARVEIKLKSGDVLVLRLSYE